MNNSLAKIQTMQLGESMEEELTVRLHTADDIPIIREWRDGWKKEPNNFEDMLSDIGVIVEGEEMQAAGFLYETNSKRCWLDMVIVNPSLSKEKRDNAINMLISELINLATLRGFVAIEAITRNGNKKLIKRCKELGFHEFGTVTYLVRE